MKHITVEVVMSSFTDDSLLGEKKHEGDMKGEENTETPLEV